MSKKNYNETLINIFIDTLNQSLNKKELLSFYENKEDVSEFYVGIVKNIFKDSILIYSLNQNNNPDGYILIRFDDLFKIEKETLYLKNIHFLNKEENNKFSFGNSITNNEYGIDYLINFFKNKNEVISIKLIYQEYIMGLFTEYDGDYLTIKKYNNFGKPDGISIIKYEDIQGIAFLREEELAVNKLLNIKNT